MKEAVEKVRDPQKKAALTKSFEQIKANHREYLAHLIRTQHQGGYYRFVLENLCPGEVVVIIDYKMKVELGLRTRENQREWYGKRGISLHGFFVIAKVILNGSFHFFNIFFIYIYLYVCLTWKNNYDKSK